ncbi:MAG: hypothetical protein HDT35_03590 [Clostridiales bacterium]|nr:hypothetical protein [Clostridiales bacterium]
MDAELSSKEQLALDAIADCMKKRLYGNVKYKDPAAAKGRACEIPHISEQVHQFWNKCTPAFEQAVSKLFSSPDIKLRENYKPEYGPETEVPYSEESLSEERYEYDEGRGWVTPLRAFERAYDEFIYSSGIDNRNQLKVLNRIFSQLCSKVDDYKERNKKKYRLRGTILGKAEFGNLEYLLDLQEDAIRQLLPYLLTAYTLTSCSSRFFYKDQTLIRLICATKVKDSERIDPIEASKVGERIKPLSKVFSLNGAISASTSRPVPETTPLEEVISNDEKPYVKNIAVLTSIYKIWGKVISDYGYLAEIDGFPSDIDWDACQKLYSSYTTTSRN